MSKSIIKRTISALAAVIAVLAVVVLGATWYVNQEPFQKRVRAMVAERAGKTFTFQKLRLSLIPSPCVTIFDPVVIVPDRIDVTVKSARLYPEVLPLLSGKIRIAKLGLDAPEITIRLAEEPGARPEDPGAVFEEARSEIRSAVDIVQDIAPDFSAEISKGQLVVARERTALLRMSDISGAVGILSHGLSLQLRGTTQRWGPVSLQGSIHAWRNSISVKEVAISGGRSSISNLSANFRWKKSPYLKIKSGQAVFFLEDVLERRHLIGGFDKILQDVKSASGTVRIDSLSFIGPLLHSDQWKLNTSGRVQNVEILSDLLPGAFRIEAGSFAATMKSLTVTGLDAGFLDSTVTSSVSVTGSFASPRAVDLSLRGRIGRETIHWAAAKYDLPRDLIVRAPCSISHLRLTWNNNGSLALSGSASLGNGPILSMVARRSPKEIRIERLEVRDEKNKAVFAFRKTAGLLDLSFRGSLTEDTVNRMFERSSGHQGWMRGDINLHLMPRKPGDSTVQGSLSAGDVFLPFKSLPLTIRSLDIGARDGALSVNTASLVLADMPLDITGRMSARDDGFRADMNMTASDLDMDRIKPLLHGDNRGKGDTNGEAQDTNTKDGGEFYDLPVQGSMRLSASSFKWGAYTFKPVLADIFLERNSVRFQILDARLCGLPLSGKLQPLDRGILLDLQPKAVPQPLGPFIDCFTTNKRIDGTFILAGRLQGQGKGPELMSSLNGSVDFAAENGKIYTYPLLARVFAFLNVTELLHGQMPDMGRNGFAYKSIRIKGDIRNGKLLLREATVEGATLNLVIDGEVDFATDKIDITILVAPFKTLEYILSKIPILRNVLANKLVTVPVRVTGDRNNPDVTPLDPAATGQHLLNLMQGIIELPFKVLSPLFEEKEKK